MKTKRTSQDEQHKRRIRDELRKAGVTFFGQIKFNARYLPQVIKPNERIKAAVYGRYKESETLSLVEGMLVATDKRIIFLNHKPGFTTMDEISYETIEDVTYTTVALFSAVKILTGTKDFSLRYANPRCAKIFVDYVESRMFAKQKL